MMTRRWNDDQLIVAVNKSRSISQVLQFLGLRVAGGNYDKIRKYITKLKLDISHFTGKGWNKHRIFIPNPPARLEDVLIKHSYFHSNHLKKRLYAEGLKKPICELCGWSKTTIDGRIPVELDHINGDHNDNRFENLRILCPNCHSLQPTHRGKNKIKYSH